MSDDLYIYRGYIDDVSVTKQASNGNHHVTVWIGEEHKPFKAFSSSMAHFGTLRKLIGSDVEIIYYKSQEWRIVHRIKDASDILWRGDGRG